LRRFVFNHPVKYEARILQLSAVPTQNQPCAIYTGLIVTG
jgi:hypothetical protein